MVDKIDTWSFGFCHKIAAKFILTNAITGISIKLAFQLFGGISGYL